MMLTEFSIYLRSLLPRSRGVKALALCLLLIPLITDSVLIVLQAQLFNRSVFMSGMLVSAYIRYLPFLVLYLIINFFFSYGYKKIMNH
jgi:hypothetical protein